MRTRIFTLIILGSIIVLSSCSTSKKAALDCPPISLNKSNKLSSSHRKAKPNNNVFSYNQTKPIIHPNSSPKKNQPKKYASNSVTTNNDKVSEIESIEYLNKAEFSKGLIASTDNRLIPLRASTRIVLPETEEIVSQQVRCDTIVLKTGANIVGKVEEIGQTEIKYRKCNNLGGPIIVISKSDVTAILYSNGSHDIIASQNPVQPVNNNSRSEKSDSAQMEGFAIGGFVAGIVGLFVFPLLFGAVAIVFGAISLNRIKKNPSKFKGKGLAIASIILGVVGIVAALIIAAAAA